MDGALDGWRYLLEQRRALTPATLDRLQRGPGDSGLSSERTLLSVLAGMANSGWPEEDVYVAVLDQANVGGRFLQRRHAGNPSRARTWLHRQYSETRTWVAANPSHDPLEDSYKLIQMREALARDISISRGQAGVTERAVLRFLISIGLRCSSVIVRAGYRTISENTCASLPTVGRVIARLQQAGWIELYQPSNGYRSTSYRLKFPTAGSLITEGTLSKGGKGTPVLNLPGAVHQLFAAQGLGRGAQESFAALPFRVRRVGSLRLVAVDRQVPRSVKQQPACPGGWPLPKAPRCAGVTADQIAGATGKSVETVRRHLRRLEQARMAFWDQGQWFRFYFEPVALAQYLQLPDTPALLRERYLRDRDGYFEFLATPKGRAIHKLDIRRTVSDGEVLFTDHRTGQVLHRKPGTSREASA